MMKLGAHQSIAGGYDKAIERIINIGGNCLQIFSSSPRGWSFAREDEGQVEKFLEAKAKFKIDPVYFHASYLVNLADAGRIGHLSKQSLIAELNLAPHLGIKGSIVHLGSFKEDKAEGRYNVLVDNIKEIIDKTPKDSLFIIENAGTRKIGQTLEEIQKIVSKVDSDRVRICLDTCHLFSNGYKFSTPEELGSFLAKLSGLRLLDKLEVWHMNDSRDPFDSGRDRHENIGQGTIGSEEFGVLLNHPKTKDYPYIIETPGFTGEGPDKKNLDILKSMVEKI